MNKKTSAATVIAVLISTCVFTGTKTAAASPPVPTAFYRASEQVGDDIRVIQFLDNLIVVKGVSYHAILPPGSGTITLNIVMTINLGTNEAHYSGSFVITEAGGTIRGRVNAKITGFSDGYVTRGTFVGFGYMNIRGTLRTPDGTEGPLVWEGVSW